MKSKFLMAALVAATLAPVAAQAQTRELQRDRNDIRQERRDVNRAERSGNPAVIRDEREDLREARREYREDSRDHHAQRHSGYRNTRFSAPFRYQRFNNGTRINAGYYNPRYYVSNHHNMRLPAPGYNMRYVRHYDDLLLVNVRSGHVIRAYRDYYR
jgi:Ni/Co efflux regulator RcnB